MFTIEQLRGSLADDQFARDLGAVRAGLATHRLREDLTIEPEAAGRLIAFVDAVIASAPGWSTPDAGGMAQRAAEISELLAYAPNLEIDRGRARIRSALLYELAGFPMMAAAIVRDGDAPGMLIDFFKRRGPFGSLSEEIHVNGDGANVDVRKLLRLAVCEEALDLAQFEHSDQGTVGNHRDQVETLARHLEADLSLAEVRAFGAVADSRATRSTRLKTAAALMPVLRSIGFPPELWEAQRQALDSGLLNPDFDAYGFAAPTGTGKTFLARLLILDSLARKPSTKILYIVPSKALVYQVSTDLQKSLEPTGIVVTAVTPQLVALETDEDESIGEASVLVLTPEKADLLLRIGAEFLGDVSVVVIDEAHHIEDGTRGVLLELYLARLKETLADRARFVLLSAVAPNINEITNWLGSNPSGILVRQRSTRMKVGIYRIRREGRFNKGIIDYTDGTTVGMFERGVKTGQRAGLVQLAQRLEVAGPLLVVAKGQGTAEGIARDLQEALEEQAHEPLTSEQLESPAMKRLDSRLEREMYANVKLRALIRYGVAYHHAGLPPRVREALEDAISEGLIRYVVATTTLAEGVNFPFSTVIVETLSIRDSSFERGRPTSYRLFTARKFWNIAGRAGRPGYDHEGQVILYEPSLGLDRVSQSIQPYLEPDLASIPPVTSALAEGISLIKSGVDAMSVRFEDLALAELPASVPRRAQGIVNLLRVGLAHSKASGIDVDADEYFGKTYAATKLPESELAFARRILRQQEQVLTEFLADPDSPSVKLVAELGLSIDTLSRLRRYVKELADWQIERLGRAMFGGQINFDQLPYLLGPVIARMAELEGTRLMGWYAELVLEWCQGKPFSAFTAPQNQTLEKLIGLMYSRIQYMLPWGLYAMDRFVAEEAENRQIPYAHEINKLAYLVDAGVPDWGALRLTAAGIERADAARLSRAYFSSREARETTDIVSWIAGQRDDVLSRIVRGADRRPIDFDFLRITSDLRHEG